MSRASRLAAAVAALGATAIVVAALLRFLAPELAYQSGDRVRELVSGRSGRTYRLALGAATGSGGSVGTALNTYLKSKFGYELELAATASPGNVGTLLDASQGVDLAVTNSADDEVARDGGVVGVAALAPQYLFVVVPNDSPAREFRDIVGPVNPGVREPGQPPTLGERILDYYGMREPDVSVVRPRRSNVQDFDDGHMVASTRTQFLHAELIENLMRSGRFRLLPIRDNEALARWLPGTRATSIPAGVYGPGRRIPPDPVPTVSVTQLLVARSDVPGRVIRDVLEVLYDPRLSRDIQHELDEASGQRMGGLRLHPAADIYYHRNDLLTSDRLGRISFVASLFAGAVAAWQFVVSYRRNGRREARRTALISELSRLQSIRAAIGSAPDANTSDALVEEADALLGRAELDAAVGVLDADAVRSLRTVHQMCRRAAEVRALPSEAPTPSTPGPNAG